MQVVDHEAIHPDVEIGQDRRVRIARFEIGRRIELPFVEHEIAHIEAGEGELVGPPVELDLGHFEEQRPVCVAELHIIERGVPQHRPADPSDRDRKPAGRRDRGDPVDDKLPPRPGVEEDHRGGEQQRHPQHGAADPAPHAAQGMPPATRRLDGVFPGHQNACPRPT